MAPYRFFHDDNMKMLQSRHCFGGQIFFAAYIRNGADFCHTPLVASQLRQRVAWATHCLALSVAPGLLEISQTSIFHMGLLGAAGHPPANLIMVPV
jgi:hypothetical protein